MRVVVLGALALRVGSSPGEVAPLSTLSLLISFDVSWVQQISKTHIPKKFSPNAVGDAVYHLCSVICRIDVNTERTLSKRCVHNPYDGIRDFGDVCIGNRSLCEAPHNFLA